MKFESRKEQIEFVVGRLLTFISGFLEDTEREEVLSVPESSYGLIALEIGKMEGLDQATFEEAIGTIQALFPSYADVVEIAAGKMTSDDRARIERCVRTLAELLKP